jgi:hypothetical protein
MGAMQRLYAELNPHKEIEEQLWYKEATKGCYDVIREGNFIKIHFDCSILARERDMKNAELHLDDRNISYVFGYDYMRYIRVSYNFKDNVPRRANSRKPVIVE